MNSKNKPEVREDRLVEKKGFAKVENENEEEGQTESGNFS